MDFDALLLRAAKLGASDLHLKLGQPPLVRHRRRRSSRSTASRRSPSRISTTCVADDDARRRPTATTLFAASGELDIGYEAGGARFRVNAFRQRGDISFAFRVIPRADPRLRRASRLPPGVRAAGRGASRPRARHRRDRLAARRRRSPRWSTTSTARGSSTSSRSRTRSRSSIPTARCIVNQREVGIDTVSFRRRSAARSARIRT